MIDTTKYAGHTPGPWKMKNRYQIYHENQHGDFRIAMATEVGDDLMSCNNAILIADAPIILEALKAAQARIAELEMVLMEHRKPPREYTDDELLDMSR
jgi:hypothetical protein